MVDRHLIFVYVFIRVRIRVSVGVVKGIRNFLCFTFFLKHIDNILLEGFD